MSWKTKYQEFWFKVGEEEFKLVEYDLNEFMMQHFKVVGGDKVEVDMVSVLGMFSKKCIIGWKGVKDEDGNDIPFTEENKKFMPYEIKQTLFNEVQSRSVLSETEKKS